MFMILFHWFKGVYCGQHKLSWLWIKFFRYTTKSFKNPVYKVPVDTNHWERLSGKISKCNDFRQQYKVSSQLFVCVRVKLGPLGRRLILLVCWIIMTSLTSRSHGSSCNRLAHKPNQVPWPGNQPICQVIYISVFCLHTFLRPPKLFFLRLNMSRCTKNF